MRTRQILLLVPAAIIAAACGRNSAPATDDALKNDLALASQAQPFNAQQITSPAEQNLAAQPAPVVRQPTRVASAPRRTSRPVTRTASRQSGSANSGGGGYYPVQAPPTTTVKHTERDAAIGAAAGAVIGATASRDKIKGGLIGAAAGAILGGVVGNNVDVQKKTGW